MAIEKDPSIYRDRGSVGNAEELDEYGVWVKSEPQELSAEDVAGNDFIEPALPDIEDLPDIELDNEVAFSEDLTGMNVEVAEDAPPVGVDAIPDEFSSVDATEMFGDALPVFEDMSPATKDAGSSSSNEDEITELSMDDFLDGAEFNGDEAKDQSSALVAEDETPLVMDLDFHDSLSEEIAMETESTGFEFEEIEQIPATEEPNTVAVESVSEFDDFLNELSGSDAPAQANPEATIYSSQTEDQPSSLVGDELAEMDIPTESLDTSFAPVAEAADVDFETNIEPLPDFNIGDQPEGLPDLLENKFSGIESEEEAAIDVPKSTVLGSAPVETGTTAPQGQFDLPTQILLRIADELASIKTEISSLKTELAILRQTPVTEELVSPSEEKKPASAKGFFDEEEDETIALTGDELDNILNTADFTEESGADAVEGTTLSVDETPPALAEELLSDRGDILGETISVETTEGEAPIPAEEEPEEMTRLRESGVQPMTEAPDNSFYLEEDAIQEIDLTDVSIEEPEFSELILVDTVLEEPLADTILDQPAIEIPIIDDEESPSIPAVDDIEIMLDGNDLEVEPDDTEAEVYLDSLDIGSIEDATSIEFQSDEIKTTEMSVDTAREEAEAVPIVEKSSRNLTELPSGLRGEVKAVLAYMDQLLESLPDDKIEEFARSEHFETYKKLFEELGLV